MVFTGFTLEETNVKKNPIHLLLLSSTLMAGTALAEEGPHSFSTSVTLVSDYVFRGVSQTEDAPALQASLDYAHESGLYLGVWGSNVDFGDDTDEHLELDYYVGFAGSVGDTGLGWDTAFIYYDYPGQNDQDPESDYYELYGALSYEFSGDLAPVVGIGGYYSPDFFGETNDAIAVDLTLDLSLPIAELGLSTLVGYQDADGTNDPDDVASEDGDGALNYAYWQIGLSRTVGPYDLGIAYSDTDAGDDDDTVIFSISSSF